MKPKHLPLSLALLLMPACEEVALPDAVAPDPPVQRAAKAPPAMGGTMLVTRDGAHAILSDPPRDTIHIVDLYAWKETATLRLTDGALPFRGVEDDDGRVHITLRGTGEVITVDPDAAEITERTNVCPNPRGVAFDPEAGSLHVACAGGALTTIGASGDITRRYIAPDLRDVFVSEGRLLVTRFRAAELLEVDEDGGWTVVGKPVSLVTAGVSRQPTTAWRTLPRPSGGWLMLHQSASTRPVPGFEEPDQNPDPGGYSGGIPCDAAVHPTLSATRDDGVVQTSGIFESPALAIDAALSPDGKRVAIATPSQRNLPEHRHAVSVFEYRLRRLTTDPEEPACEPPDAVDVDDDIVAVAYQPDGSLLAQSRSHATLYRLRGHDRDVLPLEGPDASDTGFSLFHNDAGSGIACASCHPEGGEDGRTWVFRDIGPRRTQALNVGLEGTAPFHWKGDMDDIHMIARQVRQGAMGGSEQSGARVDALRDWLFGLTPPNGTRRTSEARVEEGEQLFASLGCASCHAGPSFTSPQSADLGFGPLQTPALRGVALRPPYMHDGRAETLEEAVLDMVEATSKTVDAEQLESLVAYLESL